MNRQLLKIKSQLQKIVTFQQERKEFVSHGQKFHAGTASGKLSYFRTGKLTCVEQFESKSYETTKLSISSTDFFFILITHTK